MDRYIGIDVHARSCTFAVVDAAGKRVAEHVVETNGQALVECLRMIPGQRHVCIEEGTQSTWLYEILLPHAQQMVVTNVTDSRGQKSDHRDAFALAEKLRTGSIEHRVFKEVGTYRKLRELGRVHSMVVRDSVRVQNRIKSFMRSRGVAVEGKAVYGAEGRQQYLEKLPDGTRSAVATLYAEYDVLEEVRKRAEKELVAEARLHPASKILATCPGIGAIRAARLLPIVVTPHRFRTTRQFWSYCGLGIVMRSSADWVRDTTGDLAADPAAADARPEPDPQPPAQGDLQRRSHDGAHAASRRPAVRGLPATTGWRHQTQPGQGDAGQEDRCHRSGLMEDRGGIRPTEAPQAATGITRRGRRLSDGRGICLGRHQVAGREGSRVSISRNHGPWASALEFPSVGYAPSEYQTKLWPVEALIEGWFPRSSRGHCGFTVPSTADTTQNVSSSRTSGDLPCSPSGPERDRRSLPRLGEDAGCKTNSRIAGRSRIVCLDIHLHRSDFYPRFLGRIGK
jgi:transposase